MRPGRELDRRDVRCILADGVRRSLVLAALALLVFFFWPRDFQRQALFAKYFDFSESAKTAQVGFADSLDLDGNRVQLGGAPELVARVHRVGRGASSGSIPILWRGAVLEDVDRRGSWAPASSNATAEAFGLVVDPTGRALVSASLLERQQGATYVVERVAPTRRVFAPSDVLRVEFDPPHGPSGPIDSAPGGGVRVASGEVLRYVVETGEGASAATPELPAARRAALIRHESTVHTRATLDLAELLVREGEGEVQMGRRLSDYLSESYAYVPPGQEGARSLHGFITQAAGGHCELFASALALMLRSQGVPARVVTGFRGRSSADQSQRLDLYTLDAHAWVELFVPGEGWITLDPSPAPDGEVGAPGVLARMREALASTWAAVTGFNADTRAAVFAWIRGVPARLALAVRAQPGAGAFVLLLVSLPLILWARRRRHRAQQPTPALLRGLARAGFPLEAGETPREALARVQASPAEVLDAEQRSHVEALVRRHEAAAYGSRAATARSPR